ncbi:EF-hand domain-containing protein [Pseudophaeobacter sp.]|uniref:EF-hand domain-containing protein n=1 Tax=Pseudophaeobacter sp. TaxID=1971739 RepID=UPI002617F2AF|nr:EF-hand domain-containing protein [Pseudophaeobacter sp.]
MTKISLTAVALAALTASPLAAQAASPVDADGNGTFSLAELQTAYPDLTAKDFVEIDTNADGNADLAEVQAAQEAGNLPTAG